jgi:hypothetical protein
MGKPTLVPRRPPGRSSRKASAFRDEIVRLQSEGYTLDAIREALAAAGVVVSKSTVQREASRRPSVYGLAIACQTGPQPVAAAADGQSRAECAQGDSAPRAPELTQHLSGRDVAAAFVSQRVTNPLLRKDHR